MKVLCVLAVFVAVAWAGPWPDDMAPPHLKPSPRGPWPDDMAPPHLKPYFEAPEVLPYGLVDTVIDMVKGMLESGVSIKDKLNNLVEQATGAIDEVTDFFDQIKNGDSPSDAIVNEVFDKAIKQIMKVLEKVFDQIDSVFLTVARYADEEIGDMWGADLAKMALNKVLEKFYNTYVEKAVEALEKVIEAVNIPHEKIDKYWDDFMEKLTDAIEKRLQERHGDFMQKLKNRSRRSIEAKRSVSELEELVYGQNPANNIDECPVSTFGLASDLKSALLKVQEVLTKAKSIVTEFKAKIELIIQTAKDIRQNIQEAAGEQGSLEFVMEKVQAEIEKLVLELIDILVKEVTVVIRGIIDKVDAFISDKFCPFKEQVFQWLDDIIVSTIDNILGVIEKALKLLDRIEEGRWDDVIDHVMDIAKGKLNDMFKDIRQHIKDKISNIGK